MTSWLSSFWSSGEVKVNPSSVGGSVKCMLGTQEELQERLKSLRPSVTNDKPETYPSKNPVISNLDEIFTMGLTNYFSEVRSARAERVARAALEEKRKREAEVITQTVVVEEAQVVTIEETPIEETPIEETPIEEVSLETETYTL